MEHDKKEEEMGRDRINEGDKQDQNKDAGKNEKPQSKELEAPDLFSS